MPAAATVATTKAAALYFIASPPIGRLFSCRAQAFDHREDCADLRALLGRVARTCIPPPVPAAARVVGPEVARNRLRIKHDQPVRVGPAVVARVRHEALADG